MKTLVRISKINDTYQALYHVETEVTNNYAHKVYTNVPNMTGKINSSKTLRHVTQATKKRINEVVEIVSKETAKSLVEFAESHNLIDRKERCGDVITVWFII